MYVIPVPTRRSSDLRLLSVLDSRSVHPVESVECCHFIRFRIGWLVQHLIDKVLNGSVEMHDTLPEVDQIPCILTINVNTQNLKIVCSEYQLQQPIGFKIGRAHV